MEQIKKVAVVHDWLNGMRGGEKVLEELLDLFPQADIYTLFLEENKISQKIKNHSIYASNLNRKSFIRKRYKHFLPLFPSAIEAFDLSSYQLVVSISHCAAKGVITAPDAVHISYVNSPMRYIWDQYYSYFGDLKGIKKWFIRRQATKLRMWDVSSAQRVDWFIGNSHFIKKRIQKYYRRDADVIHPPVDTDFFQPSQHPKQDFFLTVSALVPYKEVKLLIETFNQTGDRLIVVGKGPEEKRLKKMAKSNISFKKDLSPEALRELFQQATAFVFAGIEDFGIVFVEAMACGTPVIAYAKGGVLDIVDQNSGFLFSEQTVASISQSLEKIKKNPMNPSIIRKNSLKFSRETFKRKIKDFLEEKTNYLDNIDYDKQA